MGRPLDKLTLAGFKSIRSLVDFELKKLNVLIGANGAGKSNLIEFFRLLRAMMRMDGLKEFVAGNADAFLYGGPKVTEAIKVQTRFGQNGYDFELAPTPDGFFLINHEWCNWYSCSPHIGERTRNLGSGHFSPELLQEKDEQGVSGSKHGPAWYTYEAICSWTIYHFHDTSVQSGMRRYHDQGHGERLAADAANIAPFLLNLREAHPDRYRDIVSAVRLAIPFFDDFILRPNAQENLRLDWRQKGLNDFPMRPTQLSDGSLRFICLAAALLQPELPSTVIVDEPELGLHPEAIGLLAELIADAASRTQVVIATQSATLINHFAIDDVIVVRRQDGQSTFERLREADYAAWLEDYSVGELWTKNVIAGGAVGE